LKRATVGAAGLAVGAGLAADRAQAATPTVRGSWLITPKVPAGAPAFQALAAFAADAVFVTTGSDEPGTGIGQWEARGTDGFAFTYHNFHFDSAGALASTVTVSATGTFKGLKLSGRAMLTRVDAAGNAIGSPQETTFTGRRVAVEAP
jgi:hypothetical protein